jgi:hypothetical protein
LPAAYAASFLFFDCHNLPLYIDINNAIIISAPQSAPAATTRGNRSFCHAQARGNVWTIGQQPGREFFGLRGPRVTVWPRARGRAQAAEVFSYIGVWVPSPKFVMFPYSANSIPSKHFSFL